MGELFVGLYSILIYDYYEPAPLRMALEELSINWR